MTEFIRQISTALLGIVMVGGMLTFLYKRHAEEWDILVQAYGRAWQKPKFQKNLRSMVLYTEGKPARTYPGILTLAVYSDGIGLKMISFLAPFHKPIFIPFSDIRGWNQSWYWDGESVEIAFRKTAHMRIIMPMNQIKWISEYKGAEIPISNQLPSHGNYPWLTQSIAIYSLFMLITVVGISFIKFVYPDLIGSP